MLDLFCALAQKFIEGKKMARKKFVHTRSGKNGVTERKIVPPPMIS